jgi:DNA polymerase III subunit epsilon
MRLGKLLRRRKLEEQAAAEAAAAAREENQSPGDYPAEPESDNPASDEKEPEQRVWTPESVADLLEGILRHGSHLIRRARWFCLLSESALAWNTGKTAGRKRRLVVFQGGAVIRQEEMAAGAVIPVPPGFSKSFAARQHYFDLMTYDRMRVLTTELRRLLSDETVRDVQLRLQPRIMLVDRQLLQLLKWV